MSGVEPSPRTVERAFAVAFVVLASVGWSALTLAEVGWFARGRLLGLAVAATAAAAWLIGRMPRLQHHRPRTPWLSVAVLAGSLAGAAVLFQTPVEPLINGSDASVYLSIAERIRVRGGLRVPDPILDTIDAGMRDTLLERDTLWPERPNLFPGGMQVSSDGSALQPGFFHLAPAAMAAAVAMAQRPSAAVVVSAIAVMLSVVAIWLLATELSSPLAAGIATPLLAFNAAEVWFGRLPTSEALAQWLVLSGLVFLMRCVRDESRADAGLAGAAFGLAATARLDVLLLVTPLLVGYLVLVRLRGAWTRATGVFAVSLALGTLQAVAHALTIARPYTLRILWRALGTDWWLVRAAWLIPGVLLALAAVTGLLWQLNRDRGVSLPMKVGAAAALTAAIVRSWPQLWTGQIALLLTPLGLVAMAAGAIWLATADRRSETWLLVALFVVSAVVFVDSPGAGRWMPMSWRRVIPVVLPLGAVLSGDLVARAWRARGVWRPISVALAALLLTSTITRSQGLWRATPMAGLRPQIASLAAALPPDVWLLSDASAPSHLGLTLWASFDRQGVAVSHRSGISRGIEQLTERLARERRPLMLAVSPASVENGLHRDDLAAFDLTPAFTRTLEWREIERTRTSLPTAERVARQDVEFYVVEPRRPRPLPLRADLGGFDFPWRGSGFFEPEPFGSAGVRWTSREARIELPQVQASPALDVVLRLAAPRAPGVPSPSVAVAIGDVAVGVIASIPSVAVESRLAVPEGARVRLTGGPASLVLRSDAFVPRAVGLGDDARELGVMVDWVSVEVRVP